MLGGLGGPRAEPERLGDDLAEQLEVALGLGVWPLVHHNLAADGLVAGEGVAEHDVAGVPDQDAAAPSLDELAESLRSDLLDVEARGVSRDGLDPGRLGELAGHRRAG
jgi:hypothetical protein